MRLEGPSSQHVALLALRCRTIRKPLLYPLSYEGLPPISYLPADSHECPVVPAGANRCQAVSRERFHRWWRGARSISAVCDPACWAVSDKHRGCHRVPTAHRADIGPLATFSMTWPSGTSTRQFVRHPLVRSGSSRRSHYAAVHLRRQMSSSDAARDAQGSANCLSPVSVWANRTWQAARRVPVAPGLPRS
jgi:hypothetical protein